MTSNEGLKQESEFLQTKPNSKEQADFWLADKTAEVVILADDLTGQLAHDLQMLATEDAREQTNNHKAELSDLTIEAEQIKNSFWVRAAEICQIPVDAFKEHLAAREARALAIPDNPKIIKQLEKESRELAEAITKKAKAAKVSSGPNRYGIEKDRGLNEDMRQSGAVRFDAKTIAELDNLLSLYNRASKKDTKKWSFAKRLYLNDLVWEKIIIDVANRDFAGMIEWWNKHPETSPEKAGELINLLTHEYRKTNKAAGADTVNEDFYVRAENHEKYLADLEEKLADEPLLSAALGSKRKEFMENCLSWPERKLLEILGVQRSMWPELPKRVQSELFFCVGYHGSQEYQDLWQKIFTDPNCARIVAGYSINGQKYHQFPGEYWKIKEFYPEQAAAYVERLGTPAGDKAFALVKKFEDQAAVIEKSGQSPLRYKIGENDKIFTFLADYKKEWGHDSAAVGKFLGLTDLETEALAIYEQDGLNSDESSPDIFLVESSLHSAAAKFIPSPELRAFTALDTKQKDNFLRIQKSLAASHVYASQVDILEMATQIDMDLVEANKEWFPYTDNPQILRAMWARPDCAKFFAYVENSASATSRRSLSVEGVNYIISLKDAGLPNSYACKPCYGEQAVWLDSMLTWPPDHLAVVARAVHEVDQSVRLSNIIGHLNPDVSVENARNIYLYKKITHENDISEIKRESTETLSKEITVAQARAEILQARYPHILKTEKALSKILSEKLLDQVNWERLISDPILMDFYVKSPSVISDFSTIPAAVIHDARFWCFELPGEIITNPVLLETHIQFVQDLEDYTIAFDPRNSSQSWIGNYQALNRALAQYGGDALRGSSLAECEVLLHAASSLSDEAIGKLWQAVHEPGVKENYYTRDFVKFSNSATERECDTVLEITKQIQSPIPPHVWQVVFDLVKKGMNASDIIVAMDENEAIGNYWRLMRFKVAAGPLAADIPLSVKKLVEWPKRTTPFAEIAQLLSKTDPNTLSRLEALVGIDDALLGRLDKNDFEKILILASHSNCDNFIKLIGLPIFKDTHLYTIRNFPTVDLVQRFLDRLDETTLEKLKDWPDFVPIKVQNAVDVCEAQVFDRALVYCERIRKITQGPIELSVFFALTIKEETLADIETVANQSTLKITKETLPKFITHAVNKKERDAFQALREFLDMTESTLGKVLAEPQVVRALLEHPEKIPHIMKMLQGYTDLSPGPQVLGFLASHLEQLVKDSTLDTAFSQFLEFIKLPANYWCMDVRAMTYLLAHPEKIDNFQEVAGYFASLSHAQIKEIFFSKIEEVLTWPVEKHKEYVSIFNALISSPSQELQRILEPIIAQLMETEEPFQAYQKIEQIFVKNNLPLVGKVYKIFEVLFPPKKLDQVLSNQRLSPCLQQASNTKRQRMIYGDLLRVHIDSGNRSLRQYLEFLQGAEADFEILDTSVETKPDKRTVTRLKHFVAKLNTLFLNSQLDIPAPNVSLEGDATMKDVRVGYEQLRQSLGVKNGQKTTERIAELFLRPLGFTSLEQALNTMQSKKASADARGREYGSQPQSLTINEGDLLKGIDISYIESILQNGSVAKEYLGAFSSSDSTPFDTDLESVSAEQAAAGFSATLAQSASGNYGEITMVLKNRGQYQTTTIETVSEYSRDKYEVFTTGVVSDRHVGIRTGFATTEIDFLVCKTSDTKNKEKLFWEITKNGYYIPILDSEGKVIFSPEAFDKARLAFSGIEQYDGGVYSLEPNRPGEKHASKVDKVKASVPETMRIVEQLTSRIRTTAEEVLTEQGITLKEPFDTSLLGAELLDTGSTGRHTNMADGFDFDLVLKLDRADESKASAITTALKNKLKPAKDDSYGGRGDADLHQMRFFGATGSQLT